MIAKLLFSGSGGQGVLTIGNILGNAAMIENFFVTFLPSYGAAMRGGTANCIICISDVEIASPVVSAPDIVLAMNQPSVLTFINRIEPGGQLLYNSSIVDTVPLRGDIGVFSIAANRIAAEMGDARSTNMIMLGAFLRLSRIIKPESVHESVRMLMGSKKKVAESVISAVNAGFDKFISEQ